MFVTADGSCSDALGTPITRLVGSNEANKGNLQGLWQVARTPVCFHGVLSSYLFFFSFLAGFYIMIDFLVNDWIAPQFFNISFVDVFFYSTSSVFFEFLFLFYPLFHGNF